MSKYKATVKQDGDWWIGWAVLCLFAISAATASAQATSLRGRSLAEALHVLEGRALRLIYSTEVVRPEMIVGIEPKSSEPRLMLDELLREHHLHATKGPRGSIVIVRDAEKAAPRVAKSKPAEMPVTLESIVVTPSRFTIFTSEPERHEFLSRDEVRTVPHLGDDVYRAFDRLPGITGLGLRRGFHISRGRGDGDAGVDGRRGDLRSVSRPRSLSRVQHD